MQVVCLIINVLQQYFFALQVEVDFVYKTDVFSQLLDFTDY